MKSFNFDITLIGGGCIGSSILYELTRRGFKNVGLVDHGRKTVSATANSGGMLRVFHENPEHVNLALANHSSLKEYHRAGVLTQKRETNGSLYFFNRGRYPAYQMNLNKMKKAHYPFEVFTSAQGRKKFPQFRWKEMEWAVYEPEASHLSPNLFAEDLISASIQYGAHVVDNVQVHRISRCRDHYRISGNDAIVTTQMLILAGGARLLPRLRDLGLCLPLESRTITTYVAGKGQIDLTLPNYFDRENLDFGRFGHGSHLVLSDLGNRRTVDRLWQEPVEQKSAEDCYAPLRLGFFGQVSGLPHLSLATGWGGTGFKFALEIAKRVVASIEQKGRYYAVV